MKLPDIREVKDLKGKKVLLRAELNVLVQNGKVVDDYRIRLALQTIHFLQKKGAKTIIIAHIGRDPALSLKPVFEHLKKENRLSFMPNLLGAEVEKAVNNLKEGEVLLLENLRCDSRENKNDPTFAKELSGLADIYVNDALSVSHRKHASIIGIPKYLPSYTGIQFHNEIEGLTPALTPKSPSLCIIGGAKLETKGPLIEKFVLIYDAIFVGGAIANDFFKALGYRTGRSLVSKKLPDLSRLLAYNQIVLPKDVIVEDGNGLLLVKKPRDIEDDDYIYDAGPETGVILETMVRQAIFILWNGPLGQYDGGHTKGTETLAKTLIASNAEVIIGGGDTVTATAKFNPGDSLSFVSTAGGAMLEFLLTGTLPGIDALKK